MAKKTLQQLLDEKQKHDEKGKIIAEKIKSYKRQQGERIAILAAESGLTDIEISDEEWKKLFEEMKGRFQKSSNKPTWEINQKVQDN